MTQTTKFAGRRPTSSPEALAIDQQVGRNILARRKDLGMNQATLAELIGVSFQQIQKYETGTNRVSAATLYRVSRLQGVSLDYYFEGLEPHARR
jgi:transcriptional regulator with XRE-family HTH domain